ncbi:MAG TPA: thioesterase, partial [Cytophagales bacterium]|nr:thioesterase [Cytophagales bacterium]
RRIREALLHDREAAVADYMSQIRKLRNGQPFVVYGHSMGASLGLRVVQELEKLGDGPQALVVTGTAGPGAYEPRNRYRMNDEDFKSELRKLGGAPEEVLSNAEMFEFFGRIMRADFEVVEKGPFPAAIDPVQCPIYALMGDAEESAQRIGNWQQMTQAKAHTRLLPGNHFFINEHANTLAQTLMQPYGLPVVY